MLIVIILVMSVVIVIFAVNVARFIILLTGWVITLFFLVRKVLFFFEISFIMMFILRPFFSVNIVSHLVLVQVLLFIPVSFNCILAKLMFLFSIVLNFSRCFGFFFNLRLTSIVTITLRSIYFFVCLFVMVHFNVIVIWLLILFFFLFLLNILVHFFMLLLVLIIWCPHVILIQVLLLLVF